MSQVNYDDEENFLEQDFVGNDDDDIEIVEDEESELHFSVEGLGRFHDIEGQRIFVKTDDCAACIHDIQVALRKENTGDSRRIDGYLGKWSVLDKMLVPLFLHYREDAQIWTSVLKLLVILTRPLNATTPNVYTHLKYLQDYKQALSTQDMFITLMSILVDAVSHNEKTETQINEIQTQITAIDSATAAAVRNLITEAAPSSDLNAAAAATAPTVVDVGETQLPILDPTLAQLKREEEERRIKKERKREKEIKRMEIRALSDKSKIHEKNVELVLTLIRHILEIPDPKQGDAGYDIGRSTMQIQLIKHLSDEGVLDILIMFAEQIDLPKFKHLNWLFFEIFYHICATIPPGEIANYDQLLKVDLTRLLDIEKKKIFAQVPQYARHSRFATASVLKAVQPSCGGAGMDPIGTTAIQQKAARNRVFRERKAGTVIGPDGQTEVAQPPNLFKDPAFIDINIGGASGAIINSSGGDDAVSASLPSSILGKDYKDFFADIKSFIDQFISSVFGNLMKSVYSELENEKNLHDYDIVRVLNMITWILDYQYKLVKRDKRNAAAVGVQKTVETTTGIAWATNQEALALVSRQMKLHSKEAKTIKNAGANLVVALRSLNEQIKISKLLGPNSGDAFTIIDSLCYDEIPRALTWTIRNYKPTAHKPEVLAFSLQCCDELLKVIELFVANTDQSKKSQKKKNKTRISKEEAELQGIDFYDQGYSDSDVSIRSDDDDDDYDNGIETLLDAKAGVMADICHGESIGHLFHLLQNFKENSVSTNDAVCAMILRVIKQHESYVAYFFQLSYLVVLFNIINNPTLRAVQEERKRYDSVILISKLIIRKFIKTAKINGNIFVEILFPRTKVGRYGSLLSIETDLNSICNNYTDEEARMVLERIHQGDTYENLKAEKREKSFFSTPWTEDEDQQLLGLWDHVNGMEGKSKKDKINTIIANTVPIEGKKKRKFKEVKRRLIQLGMMEDNGDIEEDDDFYSDDDYRPRDYDDDEDDQSLRSSSSSDDDQQQQSGRMNFQEYVRRVNAVKISEKLTNTIDNILKTSSSIGLTMEEQEILGSETVLKFFGA